MEEDNLRNAERGELVLALEEGTKVQVTNRTTRVTPELDMDKWRFVSARETVSPLKVVKVVTGTNLLTAGLVMVVCWRSVDLLFLILHALAVYTHFPSHNVPLPGIAGVRTLQLPLPQASRNKSSTADNCNRQNLTLFEILYDTDP